MATELLIATRSAGKIPELILMIEAAGLVPVTLDAAGIGVLRDEEQVEGHETFEANAIAKARFFAARAGGRLALADDSGLCVDALNGAPGVRSRRWAAETGAVGRALDDENNRKLLRSLEGRTDRAARYVCVAAIAGVGVEVSARGECGGAITLAPRGANGFGYDPYFLSDELAVTFAEATIEAKQRVSHRGRAVRAVLERLQAVLPLAAPPASRYPSRSIRGA
jgi:XTP/dITP diphosphohydrolase